MSAGASRPGGAQWSVLFAVVLGAIAAARCAVFFAPQILFDVDPALDPSPIGGLGLGGSLVADALVLALCGAALLPQLRRDAGVDRADGLVLALALLPLPVVFVHGFADADDLARGATLLSSAFAAATAACLARGTPLRHLFIALVLAAPLPVLVRGVANVTYEHDDTIALFESDPDRFIRARGWEPGSAQALIFERRLRQRQPLGWFITTNVFGSVAAAAMVAALGLAIGAVRRRLWGATGALAVVMLAASVGVALTGSKGALLAAGGGCALLLATAWWSSRVRLRPATGAAVAVGVVALALGAVAFRGAALPESFAGDRSLLFRWHYLVSTSHIVAERPWTGVGPAGFQTAYIQHRLPRNPEEVASAHNVFADWFAAYGVWAVPWAALLLILVARAGRRLVASPDPGRPEIVEPSREQSVATVALMAAGAVALVSAIVIELHVLGQLGIFMRVVGLGGFIFGGSAALTLLPRLDRADVDRAVAAAMIALVVHAQIEMTAGQTGAAVWAMMLVGTAGAGGVVRWPLVARGAPIVALLAAAWIFVTGAMPALRQERLLRDAATAIAAENGSPQSRLHAAATLRLAAAAYPASPAPLVWAADQTLVAYPALPSAEQVPALELALADLESVLRRRPIGAGTVRAISTRQTLAVITGDADQWSRAIELARGLAAADPNGLGSHVRLADLLWSAGRSDEARPVYQRVLEIDDAFVLDPLKQLNATDRAAVEQRAAVQDG